MILQNSANMSLACSVIIHLFRTLVLIWPIHGRRVIYWDIASRLSHQTASPSNLDLAKPSVMYFIFYELYSCNYSNITTIRNIIYVFHYLVCSGDQTKNHDPEVGCRKFQDAIFTYLGDHLMCSSKKLARQC